ncbi:helix-turn-helix transcriptional regulator [Streptomyces sp. Ru73]|uniref:AAA family ATPase n=1 Tax=Streptomyces sp. Ru73 TaxID=2080748 RepID=UPI000CDD82FF|nr:LuxR family transcriptional regulator [Streptomyces sp. Ru73]POX42238.1 helix-turn-helix transcriptional regulator [Streptomyces sp. Ru73]
MTELLEREAALGLLAAEAARARTGAGRLLLFRGPTGTGRSALLDTAALHGEQHGMRVLRADCSAESARTVLGPVVQLLDAQQPAGADEDASPMDLAARLWELLREYADASPLLLTVDNVHLADSASRRWLAEAARRLAGLPVLLVASERVQYDIAPPGPGLAHALSPSLVRAHAPAPLSPEAGAALVREAFGADAADSWVADCVRAGAGLPLLLRALLDDLLAVLPDGGRDGAALPVSCADLYPGAYAAAVLWWLDSAGPETAAVARALAELEASGGAHAHVTEELLAEVSGAGVARVPGWLTAMTRLGLLRRDPGHGGPLFAHPLLRSAVLDGWPEEDRVELHRRAAAHRYRRGDRAEAVAGHLLRARPSGGDWATDTLLDAAREASRAGRDGDAAAYLRAALDTWMPRERRAEVLTRLGALEFATVRSAGIPRLTEALRLQERPEQKVATALGLGTALVHRGEARAAFDVLRDIDDQDDPVLARTVQTAAALLSDHDRDIRREVHQRLRETAERSPDLLSPAVRTLLVRYEAAAGLLSAEAAMRQVRQLVAAPEDRMLLPYQLSAASTVAQWADALEDADRFVRNGLTERLSPLHPAHHALLNTRADTEAARGRFTAEEFPDQRPPGLPPGHAAPTNLRAHTVISLVRAGRTAEARRIAQDVHVDASTDGWQLNRFLYARGVLRAAEGDQLGALEDFLDCGRRQSARDILSPAVSPWRSAAAECHLALGRPQAALPLAEEEYRLAAIWDTPRVVGRALRVLGAATGGRHGLELTERAVTVLRGGASEPGPDAGQGAAHAGPEDGLDIELVPALITHGRQLAAAGHPRRARPLLREAAATADHMGAAPLLAQAEQALRDSGARRTPARRTGAGALTDSERRIAALAADGRSNAEIAALLHLARRTVETHLTSTYRKLGIRRRTALREALDEDGGTGP